MFSSSRLRTAGVVVATAALLAPGVQGELSPQCENSCKLAVDYHDGFRWPCAECEDGYELVKDSVMNSCRPERTQACRLGDINNKECVCDEGYYFDRLHKLSCVPCRRKNCQCDEESIAFCPLCVSGFGFTSDKQECKACTTAHCKLCGDLYTTCNTCEVGYGMDANQYCVKCTPERCLDCNGDTPSVCTKCEEGRYWNTDTNACELCTNGEGCDECTMGVNGQSICTRCRDGFNFNGPPECSKCPIDNCASCSSDGKSCYACYDGDKIYPTYDRHPNDCTRELKSCTVNGSHRVTGTTVLLGIAAAAAALLF